MNENEEELRKELHRIIDEISDFGIIRYLIRFIQLRFLRKAGN